MSKRTKLNANTIIATPQRVSVRVLCRGEQNDVGYVQCQDPEKLYTCGGLKSRKN